MQKNKSIKTQVELYNDQIKFTSMIIKLKCYSKINKDELKRRIFWESFLGVDYVGVIA